MNKTAIKNYAIWARVNLIEAAKQKAFEYEITENGEMKTGIDSIGGRLLSKAEKEQRNTLIAQIRQKGFNQVMEEVAYTWFNRFIALRFMEVNGYLPSKIRIFTDENGAFKPEILKEATRIELEGIDRDTVIHLLDKQDNEGLYKYLLITQCNALNAALPGMFEKIANYTELLFPNNLLKQDSVIGRMISDIPEEGWTDAVQIIGWLYQYYNSELKDETFALLKKNVKITKERIPAATQLFTPDWIVRYMVENSLGRLWYEGHKNDELKSTWKYYLDEAEQEPEVEEQLKRIRAEYALIKPEDIKVIDPCMGSGHILVYAFDVLMQIYTSAGWSERDAAKSILKNNLYGLDIDDRAGQLAYFAVMMKARKYNRRILSMDIKPWVMSIQGSGFMTDDLIEYVANRNSDIRADLRLLRKDLKDAKELGSIINITKLDYPALYTRLAEIEQDFPEDLMTMAYRSDALEKLLPLIKQSQVMSQKYDVVVTNPPYAGVKGLGSKLSEYMERVFPSTKADLFSVFLDRCVAMSKNFTAMVTPDAWMYNARFEQYRIRSSKTIDVINLIELGSDAFEAGFGTATFVLKMKQFKRYQGKYYDASNCQEKADFVSCTFKTCRTDDFAEIEGCKYVFNMSPSLRHTIRYSKKLNDYGCAGNGLQTNDNGRFIHEWFEVPYDSIGFNCTRNNYIESKKKWFPTVKTTSSRKWYGNLSSVVNWENDGFEIKELTTSKYGSYTKHVQNYKYYFVPGLTWSHSTYGAPFSIRQLPEGTIINIEGPGIFELNENESYVLGLLNSKVAIMIFEYTTGSIHFVASDLAKFPIIIDESRHDEVTSLVSEAVNYSKEEWRMYETAWDFEEHPFVRLSKVLWDATSVSVTIQKYYGKNQIAASPLELCYLLWQGECRKRFNCLKDIEEKLNSIFIEIYKMQGELTPEVSDRDVTIRLADRVRDVKSFISYAIGCIFGRYSLDVNGLAYAGGDWDANKYKTFIPDADNIIPICDDDYFDDDIMGHFIKFVEVVYGKETLEENLRFVADALGGSGTSREVIRKYFLNDFYTDHLKVYQKRPIYWQFDSGKKNGFKALIYMHRYQPDLLARMRTDYVHEQQERYRTQLSMLEDSAQSAAASERVKLNKQIEKLRAQEVEIRSYEEKIHHLADQMIAIDLDDGVKVNYEKFKDVLTKIK